MQKLKYLIASVSERAERRHNENLSNGFESNLEALEQEISERDHRDETRKESPLIRAEDAISIDTTSLSIEEVVEEVIKLVKNHKKVQDKL